MRMENKVAIVTGGASGIGDATVRRFLDEGAKVVIGDVNVEAGQRVAEELGESVIFEKLDVSDEKNWIAVVDRTVEHFGGLHVLVNCAGVNSPASIEEETLEGWRRMFGVHTEGAFLGCKYAFPHMKKAGYGSIVNISSNGAVNGYPRVMAYAAAKAAVHGLTRSIAAHCRQSGYPIRCNAILPGGIATPMPARSWESQPGMSKEVVDEYLQRIGKPVDLANACLFLASDEGRYVNGQCILVDGAMSNSVNAFHDDRMGPGMDIHGPSSGLHAVKDS